jgi:hypothetical protein
MFFLVKEHASERQAPNAITFVTAVLMHIACPDTGTCMTTGPLPGPFEHDASKGNQSP